MAQHHSIAISALLFCFIALVLPHAHAHEQLRNTPVEGGDETDAFGTSNTEDSRIGRGIPLILERHKRNAFNDENYLYQSEDDSDLSTDETTGYESLARVRREADDDELKRFETEEEEDFEQREDLFARVRRSSEDDDENIFTEDEDEDSVFQESNRDERDFFKEDGLVDQDKNDDRSKRSVDGQAQFPFGNQESDDNGDGNDDKDVTSDNVFKRSRRSVDDDIRFQEDDESDDDEEEEEKAETSFRTKRHVDDMNEATEDENENSFKGKTSSTRRFRRTLSRDSSEEVESAENDKDDDKSSEERLKRSIPDADEDYNEDDVRLKRDVDTKDLFMNYFNPKASIRHKRSQVLKEQQNYHSFESEFDQERLNRVGETLELRTRVRRSAKDKKQAVGGAHQVSSYTAYELKPAATSHKGKSGSGGGSSGHKSGFSAASGHKSGEGHKADKGFSVDKKGSHIKKGASGHKDAGGKKYAGGEHKSNSFKGGNSGKKGSKGHSKGHSAHKSKGQKQGGFKNKQAKDESGGKKSFYDKSDNKGYHSKYDHYDSFHVSSDGGEHKKGSHASKTTHDIHGASGHKDAGKHNNDKAGHKAEHGSKGSHDHKETTNKKASHDSKHETKH